jgi:hypothetical protein
MVSNTAPVLPTALLLVDPLAVAAPLLFADPLAVAASLLLADPLAVAPPLLLDAPPAARASLLLFSAASSCRRVESNARRLSSLSFCASVRFFCPT